MSALGDCSSNVQSYNTILSSISPHTYAIPFKVTVSPHVYCYVKPLVLFLFSLVSVLSVHLSSLPTRPDWSLAEYAVLAWTLSLYYAPA